MAFVPFLRSLFQRLLRRPEQDRDLDDELRFHVEMLTEENVRLGMDPEEARRQAVLLFGGVEGHKEAIRAGRPLRVVEDTVADVRYAARVLWKNRSFTGLAVLALAVGIGTTTAVYSVADQVLLRPIQGVRDADELVVVQFRRSETDDTGVSHANLMDLAAATPALVSLAGVSSSSWQMRPADDAPRFLQGQLLAGDYFGVLGLRPQRGRLFSPSELDPAGASRVAVISDAYWRSDFGAAEDVVGRTIELNGVEFVVIGVGPPGFRGMERLATNDVWVPISAVPALEGDPSLNAADRDAGWAEELVGRLRPGAIPELAETQLRAATERLVAAYPREAGLHREWIPYVTPGIGTPVAGRAAIHGTMRLLGAIGALVLLIACANVSNLILFRGIHRRGEIAVRRALGASNGRILRQYLVEGILISVVGGVAGVAFGLSLTTLFAGANFLGLPPLEELGVDGRVLAFAVAVALGCGLLCGLLPALASRRGDFLAHLKDASRAETGRTSRVRAGLTVAQVAASVLLLAGALLLLRTLHNLRSVELGFEADRVLAAVVVEPPGRSGEEIRALRYRLLEALGEIPGVESASVVSATPFGGRYSIQRVRHPSTPGEQGLDAETFFVSTEFFAAMGIPLLAGRTFTRAEIHADSAAAAEGPVVISRSLALRFFGRVDPIGQRLLGSRYGDHHPSHTVVGVVGDTRAMDLRAPPSLGIYQPIAAMSGRQPDPTLVVRLLGPRADAEERVAAMVARVDPSLMVYQASTISDLVEDQISENRLLAHLVGLLAAVAVLLAATGLYGLIAYSVARRTREIGIRMALGAHAPAVVRLVSRQSTLLVAAGVAIGTVAAVASSRVLESRLFGVEPLDPLVYLGAAAIFLVAALLATASPVRAATRVDPVVALRSE